MSGTGNPFPLPGPPTGPTATTTETRDLAPAAQHLVGRFAGRLEA